MVIKHTFFKNERTDYSDVNCHFWFEKPVGMHTHTDYYEVAIATEGEQSHEVNDVKVNLARGYALVISPDATHKISFAKDSKHFNIAVKVHFFERLTANKSAVREKLAQSGFFTIRPSDTACAFIEECISKIDNDNFGAFSYTLVETVLSVVFLSVMNGSNEPRPDSVAYYCLDAINKIENGTLLDTSASAIYSLYPVSHTAFINEFKRITGKTPSNYLTERRLAYAKKLLLTTDYSVLEIAAESGFDSVSHFIKIFKKAYGETPLRFKKNG